MSNFAEIARGNFFDLDRVSQVVKVWMPNSETDEIEETYLLLGETIGIVDPAYLGDIQRVIEQHERS